ncbi:two-component regulator propeller domain-containing protein [Wenyingzhuangia sp. IMCC45467]
MKNFFFFLFIFSYITIFSQNKKIEKLNLENGLLNNSVRGIIQDNKGYLWFGTFNGLSRYDGKNFINYNSIAGDTTSFKSSRVIEIIEDEKGFIWCLSDNNNLQRIDPLTNKILDINKQIIKDRISIQKMKLFSNGDLWVWGKKGCARIVNEKNSINCKIYNTENGIDGNLINFIFEDDSKNIWIGTKSGLSKIVGNRITNYQKNTEFVSYKKFHNVIWFGTKTSGVFKHMLGTNKIIPFDLLNKVIDKRTVLCISQTNDDLLHIITNNYVLEFNMSYEQITILRNEHLNDVYKLYKDSGENLWLSKQQDGILKYNIVTKKITHYNLNSQNRSYLGISDKLILLEDSNQKIWVGTNGGGLFEYNGTLDRFINYTSNPEKSNTISSNTILSMFEDASKNLWIGTMYGGINKINISKNKFTWHLPTNVNTNIYINEIRSSVQDKNGILYVGSKGGKIFCYKNYELLYVLPDDLSKKNQLKLHNINVYKLFLDRDDNLWVGTKGRGLYVLKNIVNTSPKDIDVFTFDIKNHKMLNNAYDIVQDINNNYWIASHYYGLTFLLSDPFKEIKKTTYWLGTKNEFKLTNNYLRSLLLDNNNNLWIGSSGGINFLPAEQLNSKNRRSIPIKNIESNPHSLSNNTVDHIFQAKDSTIYVSTMGGGLNILENYNIKNKDFKWKTITTKEGLSSNIIYGVQEDIEQNIWISTNNGIDKYYPKTGKIERFFDDVKNGNYFTEGSVSTLKNGDILFGHHNGFITFNPKNIIKDTTSYPLVLSKLYINGIEQFPRNSDVISKNIEYEKEINLTYTQNTIQLDFSVLDYKNPEKIQYSYKLENYDKTWSTPLTTSTAMYRNLPHGNYSFLLKATNSDGIELPEILEFKINIKPPFIKSYLGYFLMILFFSVLFGIFLYLYKKQINTKNEINFAKKLNDKKLIYYTNISHEFKTPLTLISCYIQDVLDDSLTSQKIQSNAKKIQKSSTYLLNLVEQILDFRKIREEKMKLNLINTNIVFFIHNIYSQFLPLANKDEINLSYKSEEEDINGYIDVNILKKILYNLLSNAIKFTPSGKSIYINLILVNNNQFIQIEIKDEGKGISENDLQNLFERFGKSENSSGIGLFYVKELVSCHKGNIEVSSDLETGTTFTITLPISQKYYDDENIEVNNIIVNENNLYEPNIESSGVLNHYDIDENEKKKTYSILIIEDNDEMRNYLCEKFQSYFNVFSAENGKIGVRIAIKELPDIIVCDLMMPVMDGIETIKTLRDNFNTCHIPMILLTANSSEHQKIEGVKVGIDDFITKPFNFKYLKLKIEGLITQRNKIIQSFSKNPELSTSIITNSDEDQLFIEQVKQIVERSIGEANFSINSIISELGISRTNFFNKMKDITGDTPNQFISTIQMKKASVLLKETNYPISEISVICGFNDSRYFAKMFKKYFGNSPKEYQLKNK